MASQVKFHLVSAIGYLPSYSFIPPTFIPPSCLLQSQVSVNWGVPGGPMTS
jgi:hypothetical protein